MLGFIGRDKHYHKMLLTALIKASKHDPYLKMLGGSLSHDDGWGRVLITKGRSMTIIKYKSLNPIFNEDHRKVFVDNIKDFIVDVVHARKRSKGMPKNLISTQPIEVLTYSGTTVFIAHNGTLDKKALINLLDKRLDENAIKMCSDTCLLALYLSERLSNTIEVDLLNELKKITASALNLIILLISEPSIEILFGSYYKRHHDYYKLYLGKVGENYIIASSSIVDFYIPRSDIKWEIIGNGTYHKFLINLETLNIKMF
jgi:predicted glutamine amidotransferase